MKRKRFTEEQIAFARRQAESGNPVEKVIRKLGVSEATFYRWKKKYAGLGVAVEILDDIILALAEKIERAIRENSMYFSELAERFSEEEFLAVTRAMGELHRRSALWLDKEGRYCLLGSPFAATLPPRE